MKALSKHAINNYWRHLRVVISNHSKDSKQCLQQYNIIEEHTTNLWTLSKDR